MDKLQLYRALSPALRPFGGIYARVMRKRRELYASGAKNSYSPSVPCISVGNIAWGGTGKTPVVGWFLDWAKERGLKAAVLSRGYKAEGAEQPLLVDASSSAYTAGDEPLLLARAYPEANVVVFPKRAESARYAEADLKPDLLLLDDGMQHLAVSRDFDLVLLRPEDVDGEWNRVIPSGSWREGSTALRAASAFAMKVEPEDRACLVPLIKERLSTFSAPFFFFSLAVKGLKPLFPEHAEDIPLRDKAGGYILVSGVGNHAGVRKSATNFFGSAPVEHLEFSDHHAYSAKDVQDILRAAGSGNAAIPVICTGKDAVKLGAYKSGFKGQPVFELETGVEFGPPYFDRGTAWAEWWEGEWQRLCRIKE